MISGATLRRYWPPETQIMLLRAVLAEPAAARAAWRDWTALRDLDSATWSEVRLLANLASRMHIIDPDSPLEPRIRGIRRFIWTHAQLCLTGARPLLAALAEAGIPMVALKGAARALAGAPGSGVRFLRDVDVLVRPDDWAHSLRIADAQGWRCVQDKPYAGALQADTPAHVYPVHHAVALALEEAQVDLHHHALYMCRVAGDDDGMWARATPARLHGVPLLAPAATDELMQALAHGAQFSPEPIADWALDAAALIAGGKVDWALLEQDAQARRIESFLASSLMLLEERLDIPVPAGLTARLRRRVRGVFVTDFIGYATGTVDYPWMYDTHRQAAVLRADARTGGKAGGGLAARQVVLAGDGLRFPDDGTPLTIPVPTPLPPHGRLRLLIDVAVGVVPPRESLVLAVRAPGVPLRWFRTRLRGRWAGWRRRRRLRIDLPTHFYAGRGIDRVTVDLYTPGPGRATAVKALNARWIVEAPVTA